MHHKAAVGDEAGTGRGSTVDAAEIVLHEIQNRPDEMFTIDRL
jgi:hypothetical protein